MLVFGGEPPPSGKVVVDSVLARGTQVGHYVFLDVVGAGGMGVVYAAYDADLDRKVAIKVLRGELHGESGERNLLREAQAMAKLSHPNVVTVFEVGTVHGQVFVAMEYVDGQTLTTWVRSESRSWRDVLDVMLRAGAGLAAAHSAGIVHRDFKPDNIVIGKDGRVRVMDFGLARQVEEQPGEERGELAGAGEMRRNPGSASGAVGGTPAYMSPEQYRREACDARSDQFSYCVTLWEALYGERPFAGDRLAELSDNILRGRLHQPRNPRGPRALRQIMTRGLSTDRAARHGSMNELLAALGRAEAGVRRRGRLAVVAAVLAVGVGLVVTRSATHHVDPCARKQAPLASVWNPERQIALARVFSAEKSALIAGSWPAAQKLLDGYARDWNRMEHEVCVATRVRGEQSQAMFDQRMLCLERRRAELRALIDILSTGDRRALLEVMRAARGLSPVSDCSKTELMASGVPAPADQTTRRAVAEVRAQLAEAKALGDTGNYQRALTTAQAALKAAGPLHYRPVEAEAEYTVGLMQWQVGHPDKSEESLIAAASAAMASRYALLRTEAQIELIYVVGWELKRPKDSAVWAKMAEASLEALGDAPLLRARMLANMGPALYRGGELERALKAQKEALAIRLEVLGKDHPDVATSYNQIAVCEMALKDYDQALEHERKCLDLRRALLGAEHPLVAEAHNNLGNIYFEQEQYDQALAEYRTALAIWREGEGKNHPNIAIALTNIANVHATTGSDKALAEYQQALEIEQAAYGDQHPEVASSEYNVGMQLMRKGRAREAVFYLEKALAIWRQVYGEDNPDTLQGVVSVAEAHQAAGEVGPARELLETAAIRGEGVDPGLAGQAQFDLARILWKDPSSHGRAAALARTARANLDKAGQDTEEVDEWLARTGSGAGPAATDGGSRRTHAPTRRRRKHQRKR